MDRNSRYNFPARWGVNIFSEVSQESLEKSVEEWLKGQRKLKET
jgi:L-glyceraldehyde reductase